MATRWQDDPRLPADLRNRAADVNDKMAERKRELDAEAAAEQAERDRLNTEARNRYLAGLAEEKAAEQARRDAEEEQRLAPVKRREMLQWLVDHPGTTEADFEKIWPAKRELLQLDARNAAIQREVDAQRGRS